jgi:hypothetical protein
MPTENPGSVTRWIGALKDGGRAAAQPLWDRYFERLVNRARARLRASGFRGDATSAWSRCWPRRPTRGARRRR